MTKPRLRYTRRGWFKLIEWRTGSVDSRGRHWPDAHRGKLLPEWMPIVIGPFETARGALGGF